MQGNSQRIVTSALDTNDCTYCTLANYPKVDLEIENIAEGEFADGALNIITKLRDLDLQIVMAIAFLPKAVSLDSSAEVPSKGFGKKLPTAKF